jgi:hypothetical protein
MDEFVFKPPKSCGIEDLANSAGYVPDTAAIRMIRQANIERSVPKARFLPSGTGTV